MKQKDITSYLPAIILMIGLLSLWEMTVQIGHIPKTILPAPSLVITSLFENWSIIAQHAFQTMLETIIGLIIAVILGLGIAILLDMSSWIRKAVYPLLITSQTIPMIALAPLLLIWFGFGLLPKVIVVVLYCFFPIVIATVDGFAKTDKDLLKLLKSMHASYWQTMRYVKLPGSLPHFFSGLKIAVTYSVAAAIVGEYVGSYMGLGIYMQQMANSYAIGLVFATIFVISLLSLCLFGLVVLFERIFVPWHKN